MGSTHKHLRSLIQEMFVFAHAVCPLWVARGPLPCSGTLGRCLWDHLHSGEGVGSILPWLFLLSPGGNTHLDYYSHFSAQPSLPSTPDFKGAGTKHNKQQKQNKYIKTTVCPEGRLRIFGKQVWWVSQTCIRVTLK